MLSMSWMATHPHQHCPPDPLGVFMNVPTARPVQPILLRVAVKGDESVLAQHGERDFLSAGF